MILRLIGHVFLSIYSYSEVAVLGVCTQGAVCVLRGCEICVGHESPPQPELFLVRRTREHVKPVRRAAVMSSANGLHAQVDDALFCEAI